MISGNKISGGAGPLTPTPGNSAAVNKTKQPAGEAAGKVSHGKPVVIESGLQAEALGYVALGQRLPAAGKAVFGALGRVGQDLSKLPPGSIG